MWRCVWGSEEGFIGEEESKATNRNYHQKQQKRGKALPIKTKNQ
jgi:hypothetical protein